MLIFSTQSNTALPEIRGISSPPSSSPSDASLVTVSGAVDVEGAGTIGGLVGPDVIIIDAEVVRRGNVEFLEQTCKKRLLLLCRHIRGVSFL